MNVTVTTTVALSDLVSTEVVYFHIFVIGIIIKPPIYLFGIIANLINISVYLKIGLRDCINICFFILSCADLISVLLLTLDDISHWLTDTFVEVFHIRGKTVAFLVAFYYGAIYDISQGITTFIAVQKCWCVALPFRFKGTFTATRTAYILTGISLTVFSIHLPVLTTQGTTPLVSTDKNTTVLILWFADIRKQLFPIVGIVSLIFTNFCQFTVIFCLFILASRLRASSKFRKSSTMVSKDQQPTNSDIKDIETKAGDEKKIHSSIGSDNFYRNVSKSHSVKLSKSKRKDKQTAPQQANTVSGKELQAIKSTTFVSILFVSFNTFKLLNYYVILFVPEYTLFGRLNNVYIMSNNYRLVLEALHIACNVFVYLKFNSKFRSIVVSCCENFYLRLASCIGRASHR